MCCASLSLWVLHSKDASSAPATLAPSLPELDRICENPCVCLGMMLESNSEGPLPSCSLLTNASRGMGKRDYPAHDELR